MTPYRFGRIRMVSLAALVLVALSSGAFAGHEPGAGRRPNAPDVDSLSSARACLARGRAAYARGDYPGAAASMDSAVSVLNRQLPDSSLELARARVALGSMWAEAGRFANATTLLARGMETLDTPASPDSDALAAALHAQGKLLTLTSNLPKAKQALVRALAIRTVRSGETSADTRSTLNLLANAYSATSDFEHSRPIYERLIALERANPKLDSLRLAGYLTNLANNVSDQKPPDYDLGRRLYAEALGIKRRALGPEDPRLATTIVSLASLSEVTGADDDALMYLRQATEIYEKALGPQHPETAELYLDQAKFLFSKGDFPGAFELALRGERLTREHIRLTARSLTAASALQFEQTRFSGLDVALDVLEHAPRIDATMRLSAFDEIVRSRSVLLDEFAARNREIAGARDSQMTALVEARAAAQRRLAEWTMKSMRGAQKDSSYRAKVNGARAAAEAAEERLARATFERGGTDQLGRSGAEAVRASLPPRSALLSIVRFSARDSSTGDGVAPTYMAFVQLPGRDAPRVVALGRAREIDSLVTGWLARGAVPASNPSGDAERRYRAAAERLRRRIWDPVAPLIAGASCVFVVPDGSLHLVSFATLPTGTARFLAETGPMFHYLSTERDLLEARPRLEEVPSLLVFGGVDYDHDRAEPPADTLAVALRDNGAPVYRGASPRCEAFARERFPFLVGSLEEADEVSAQWRQLLQGKRRGGAAEAARLQRLSGPAATEAAFKHLAPDYAAVHIATHGFFVDPACATNADPESEGDAPADQALLQSGLVLAGANQHRAGAEREDGFLTAEEIAAMDLRTTRWVALSGCNTGLGAIVDQEGVFGLRRAFHLAGAGTVVMSLWSVRDSDSERWMRLLYEARFGRRLSAPAATSAAMRGALAELRARGEPLLPARWGAFVSCGAWR